MTAEVHALEPFKILYNLPKDTNFVVIMGGRGGAKTYEVSKFVAFSATVKRKRCVVLRDEKELVRESILNEILARYDTANEYGAFDGSYDKLDTGIRDKRTGEMLVFTKGFRASQTDKKANLKSISNIDIAVVEEAEDITDVDKFNTFADSIRNEGSVIILILNTPDVGHWIIKQYFNTKPTPEGYFEVTPKNLPGFLCIQTSYKDNKHLPATIVERYESYGDPNSHRYNPFYYWTAIRGLSSSGRKGQVFKKVQPISLADYLKLPHKEIFGLDFGTASPAGIVGVKIYRNTVYVRQLNYKPMTTLELARFFAERKFGPADLIVADSADPKSWKRLRDGYQGHELSEADFTKYPALRLGFNVVPAKKGEDSIRYGIDILSELDFYAVESSLDLWNEVRQYVYVQDKNGNYTNEPIDDFNHLLDPVRYAVTYARSVTGGDVR